MSIELHTIKAAPGSRTKKFRIGRGNSSGRGTTAGKGTKGQRARSGGRNKLKLKGMKQMLLSFPKNRGFKSGYVKPKTLTIAQIAKVFTKPATINLKTLKNKHLINKSAVAVKIVAGGKLETALKFKGISATEGAKKSILEAGGQME